MNARTYIFLDIDVSTTQYQITTTAGDAVGNNRVLIGSAINGTVEATFTIFSGDGAIKISKEGLEDGSIDLSKFSNGLTPVEVLDVLPTENNFDGRIVFLTTDKKLYRYDGTQEEFTAAIPTTDLTGTITGEQIASSSIDLSKFSNGLTPIEVLDALPAENNFDGRTVFLTTDKKLHRYDTTEGKFTTAVPTTDLTGTIVETQIADNSISTGKIKANAITANEIAAGTITGNKIAANTIEAGNIAAGTITGDKIAAQTIAAAHIITGTITATQIATNTITANQIAANTITAGQIATGAITANEIAVGTITGNKIAAGTIEAGNIAAGTITGNEIAANTIEAGNIKAGTITTVELNFTPVKDTNVIASINASEEGIDISASKIATISAEKILIDGTTYLSNWRKTGDLTKIDGGSIATGSITTAQLNFTPVIDGTIIASINASEEGIQISGEHIAISGSTTFSSGYDPITKVNKLGGSYASASSGARVLIFPDTNTGLQIIDNDGADVFKAIIGGDNVGDVIIGNYTGGQGIFYDKSKAKTIFKGSMTAGDITGVTITGGTIQTATSGQRVAIASSDNTITFYNSSNTAITQLGGGDDIGTALRINLDSSTTNGILISANNTTGGNGFYYTNASNVRSRGLYIKKTSTGANNDYPAIEVEESGSGEIMYCDIKGSGSGIEIWRQSGSGTDYGLKISTSIAYNTKGLLVEKLHSTGVGVLGEFYTEDRGTALKVVSNNSSASNPALSVSSNSGSDDTAYFYKGKDQNVIRIKQVDNSGNNNIGIKMEINNAGLGKEYAFEFAGSEYIAGATGVSGLTGVIRILTSDGLCYIPVYSSYS